MKHLLLCLFALCLCVFLPSSAVAQWPTSASDNLLICDHSGEQALPKIRPTSDGGCYICWYDNSSGNYDVYLQRLDGDGVVQWETNGLLVSNHPQNSWITDWDMTVDLEDHCIIAVNDIRAGTDWDIYAYRISPAGEFVWGDDGIAISDNDSFEPDPRVAVTTDGGIVFSWQEETAQGMVVNLRKLTTAGTDMFFPSILTSTSQFGLSIPRIVAADEGSVILQFLDSQGSEFWQPRHIYMQKYDATGNELWFEDPTAVMTTGGIGIQMKPDLAYDGNGGAYSYWYDTRNMDHHVFVQHVNNMGVAEWTTDGVQVDLSASELQMVSALTVTNDGVVVFYPATNMSQSMGGLQVQKLNTSGELQWGNNGIVLIPLVAEPTLHLYAFQQGDYSTVVYQQYVVGSAINTIIRAIQVDNTNGDMIWEPSPRDICSVASGKGHLNVTVNPFGQVIAAWPDSRVETHDIYVQNINPDGSLGPLGESPLITITQPTAPNDTAQVGNTVNIHFEVENFVLAEIGGDGAVEFSLNGVFANYLYTTQTIMLALVDEGVHEARFELVDNNEDPLNPPVFDVIWLDNRSQLPPSITITSPEDYVQYTTQDSAVIEFETENFVVAEGTGDGWIFVFSTFTPYGGEPEVFTHFFYASPDPFVFEFDEMGGIYEVSLSLVDNSSLPLDPAVTDTVHIEYGSIAVDDLLNGMPETFALHSAYPNPFNPETTIRFDVASPAQVTLTVHDLLGREVDILLNDTRDAGTHSVVWRGTNSFGQSMPSGVYFVKMNAGVFTATQKLMLIR